MYTALLLTPSQKGRAWGCCSGEKSVLLNEPGLLSISSYFLGSKLKGITTETQGNIVTIFQIAF